MRSVIVSILLVTVVSFVNGSYAKPVTSLSLTDAIMLAVRTNPNVQSAKLSLVVQKFNVFVQKWEFSPQYSLQATAALSKSGTGIQPALGTTLLTPIGTQMNLSLANTTVGQFNPGLSLQIMQPLMRGFGSAIVEAALNNAKDTEAISILNVEGSLRGTVTLVINAYLDVVMAERSITIDQDALQRAQKAVTQTRLFIKAGHKAGNELVTVQANVASAKTQLINDKNNLIQARNALLAAIGVDPNAEMTFSDLDVAGLIAKYQLPNLTSAKELILKNDIQYQVDQITLHGPTSRSLLIAEDNTRWQLNVAANATTNNGVAGLNNSVNQAQSVGLTLQIPIQDQLAKQAVVNAKVAIKQAELALLQEKWSKETSAINAWNTVVSAKSALQFANEAEGFQEKTYRVSYQKYAHGLIDSLELQTAQIQLIQAQQVLLRAQITYLKALVGLDYLIGHTLKTWDVKVRLQ